jgi:hypothetical protein
VIEQLGVMMKDADKFKSFVEDKYIPYLKYIASQERASRFIVRYEDLATRPEMEMTELMETTVRAVQR